MKIYTVLGCVLALTVVPVFAADAPQAGEAQAGSTQDSASAEAPAKGDQKLSFKDIDTDGDGYIGSVEAYVAGFVVGPMDTDKDGRLTEQEYNAAQATAGGGVPSNEEAVAASESAAQEPGETMPTSHLNDSLGQAATAPETSLSFEQVDSDGDGMINKEELAVAGFQEKEVDSDQDGQITRQEYESFHAKLQEARGITGDQQPAQSASAGE